MSSKIKFLFVIAVCTFLVAVISFFVIRRAIHQKDTMVRHDMLTNAEFIKIRPGDIILRRGFGWMSTMIVDALNEDPPVSHCGIILKQGGRLQVVHSISKALSEYDGVQCDALDKFVRQSKPNSLIVVRLRELNPRVGMAIHKTTLDYLERRIPFDHAFDLQDTARFYCNELVRNILLKSAGVDIYPGKSQKPEDHVKFKVFFDPVLFKVVINHQE